MSKVICTIIIALTVLLASVYPSHAQQVKYLSLSYINGVVMGETVEEGYDSWLFHDESGSLWHIRKEQADDFVVGEHGVLVLHLETGPNDVLFVKGTYLCNMNYNYVKL